MIDDSLPNEGHAMSNLFVFYTSIVKGTSNTGIRALLTPPLGSVYSLTTSIIYVPNCPNYLLYIGVRIEC